MKKPVSKKKKSPPLINRLERSHLETLFSQQPVAAKSKVVAIEIGNYGAGHERQLILIAEHVPATIKSLLKTREQLGGTLEFEYSDPYFLRDVRFDPSIVESGLHETLATIEAFAASRGFASVVATEPFVGEAHGEESRSIHFLISRKKPLAKAAGAGPLATMEAEWIPLVVETLTGWAKDHRSKIDDLILYFGTGGDAPTLEALYVNNRLGKTLAAAVKKLNGGTALGEELLLDSELSFEEDDERSAMRFAHHFASVLEANSALKKHLSKAAWVLPVFHDQESRADLTLHAAARKSPRVSADDFVTSARK